ncbi:hypothetical protein ACEPAI_9654 [Sanghuangporus weigelae]
MSAAARSLSRLFTPCYAARINSQIVHPATSVIVKPNELKSALARPLHVAQYEPERPPEYYAAQISYGIIMGHPFMDGNKRTAFFLANEYLRAQGRPGLTEVLQEADALRLLAQRYIQVAKGEMDVEALAFGLRKHLS